MKFAVTGSSGFIGRNLIKALSSREISYHAFSRQLASSFPSLLPNTLHVDYSDVDNLRKALYGCDCVVHLAGLAHQFRVPASKSEGIFKSANVDILTNMALAASEVGVKKFIFVSTIGVLGHLTQGDAFSDLSIPHPTSPYSISKLEAEFALQKISDRTSLPFVVLRPPLVYGENCPGNLARLIRFIRLSPALPLGGVNCMRSFLSVNHLADMIIRSAFSADILNDTYALSDSVDLSLHDVFLSLINGLGKSARMLVDVDLSLLYFASRLVGRQDAFLQLSSELLVDSTRFCEAANWQPFLDPFAELEFTAKSFRV